MSPCLSLSVLEQFVGDSVKLVTRHKYIEKKKVLMKTIQKKLLEQAKCKKIGAFQNGDKLYRKTKTVFL